MRDEHIVGIRAHLEWQVRHDLQDGTYLGVCWSLNLNASGDTMEELLACATEATALLFEDLYSTGELDEFLQEQGWTRTDLPAGGEVPRFDVPLDFRRTTEDFVAHA